MVHFLPDFYKDDRVQHADFCYRKDNIENMQERIRKTVKIDKHRGENLWLFDFPI